MPLDSRNSTGNPNNSMILDADIEYVRQKISLSLHIILMILDHVIFKRANLKYNIIGLTRLIILATRCDYTKLFLT